MCCVYRDCVLSRGIGSPEYPQIQQLSLCLYPRYTLELSAMKYLYRYISIELAAFTWFGVYKSIQGWIFNTAVKFSYFLFKKDQGPPYIAVVTNFLDVQRRYLDSFRDACHDCQRIHIWYYISPVYFSSFLSPLISIRSNRIPPLLSLYLSAKQFLFEIRESFRLIVTFSLLLYIDVILHTASIFFSLLWVEKAAARFIHLDGVQFTEHFSFAQRHHQRFRLLSFSTTLLIYIQHKTHNAPKFFQPIDCAA